MALVRDKPIAEVVSRLDLALPGRGGAIVAPSSVSQARQRLGPEPMEWLFNKSAEAWAHASARDDEWRGLALYAIDGTTLRVADSDTNREHFGLAIGGARGASGYPLVRLAAVVAVRSHLLARVFGPYSTSELALCRELWAQIPRHSLTILDRNFLSANVLVGLNGTGAERHWMTRAKGPRMANSVVQGCSEARTDDVVPIAMEVGTFDFQLAKFLGRNPFADGVSAPVETRAHNEPSLVRRVADEVDDRLVRA